MEIFKILLIAVLTCVAGLIVKQIKPDFASLVVLSGGVVILLMLIGYVEQVLNIFQSLADKANLSPSLFSAILKIIGIGYLTEFTASLCSDTGASSLAAKVGLAGKVVILFLALPIITNLLDVIMGIMP